MDDIFKESVKVENMEVLSEKGWIPVEYVHKTYKFNKFLVLFESGREIECADNHCFIGVDKNILAKDLKIGDEIKSIDGYDIIFDIFDLNEQEEMYDFTLKEHHHYFSNEILSHNSNVMINIGSRQALHGYNVVILSLEMAEDAVAQRLDSIYTNCDINRMYVFDSQKAKMYKKLKELSEDKNRGQLFIKQFPTGQASVLDYRTYLRELVLRGIKPSIIYVDYINLMRPSYKTKGDMYQDVKRIAEELRALSFEFDAPVVSVSQLNREGAQIAFDEVDFVHSAECLDPNSIINTKSGDKLLKELKIGDYIKGSNGYVKVNKIFDKKIKQSVKIKTKSGKTIICSKDHKFPTNNGLNSINTGLKIGDKLHSTEYIDERI